MARHALYRQTACKHCGQDIENHGKGQWLDRGAGRACLPFIDRRKGEIVKPRTKHAPTKD